MISGAKIQATTLTFQGECDGNHVIFVLTEAPRQPTCLRERWRNTKDILNFQGIRGQQIHNSTGFKIVPSTCFCETIDKLFQTFLRRLCAEQNPNICISRTTNLKYLLKQNDVLPANKTRRGLYYDVDVQLIDLSLFSENNNNTYQHFNLLIILFDQWRKRKAPAAAWRSVFSEFPNFRLFIYKYKIETS